jgi:hypothetical protein
LKQSLLHLFSGSGGQNLSVVSQGTAVIGPVPDFFGQFVQVDLGLGAICIAATLGNIAGKNSGGFSLIAFIIGAQIHTGAAADAQIMADDVFKQLLGSKNAHYRVLRYSGRLHTAQEEKICFCGI